ncbi:uncharacterized protein [Nicotiana sylvestris]|uniref:uncharacterized protein n=1 Tax=Nicotiana sylvestris TaxID=4096 RepID=UPI00388CD91D
MKDNESIQDMHTRFTSIINELHSFGEIIPRNKLVRKIFSIRPSSWESKVNAITEAKDLHELTIDELVGNLNTYEMKRKIDNERREPKKENNLVLKAESNDSNEEDNDMAYLIKRFQKMVRKNGVILKRGNSSKSKNYDLCHKCGKPGHFFKDCPLLKKEHSKYNLEKAFKRNPVPDKHFKRKRSADNVVKQDLATWGDSSSESENETDAGDSSMMSVESEENENDSIFSVMAQSDDDNSEVNFRDVQRNPKSYSPKKLMSLANVLINAYHSLVEDKDALTLELREAKQTRDDLVVCVVDLKETICELEKEKFVLTEKIANIEHGRDDLVVVVVDHKEPIENFSKEKEALVKRGTVKGSSQQWFMNSGFSKHMTGNTTDFLSLKALQGGSVSFGNGKKGLLSVSQICDKGKKVEFLSKIFTVTNLVSGEVVLVAKRYKNIYAADFESIQSGDLSCLKAVDDYAEPWHRRLGHASFSLLNKLIQKDLIRGYPCQSSKCMIRSLLNKTPYELMNGRKPKRTHLRTFGCKCYVLNNGKDQLGKFDAKSDKGIFLGYSSQSKAYKICNKQTQCVDESVHVIFDESYPSCEKSTKDNQDGEPLLVPGEVINMTNGKADIMSQVKEPSGENVASSSRELGTSITTTEAEERVVDVVQGTPQVPERRTQGNQLDIPSSFINEPQMPN